MKTAETFRSNGQAHASPPPTPPTAPDLAALFQKLSELCGLVAPATVEIAPLRLRLEAGSIVVCLTMDSAKQGPSPANSSAAPVHQPEGKPLLRGAYARILRHAPIGEEARVKSSTLIVRSGFPKPNSYNRALIATLVEHGLLVRHPEDQKVYRPAGERGQS